MGLHYAFSLSLEILKAPASADFKHARVRVTRGGATPSLSCEKSGWNDWQDPRIAPLRGSYRLLTTQVVMRWHGIIHLYENPHCSRPILADYQWSGCL